MQAALLRWMDGFHIDGIRMDSVENVFSWNFSVSTPHAPGPSGANASA